MTKNKLKLFYLNYEGCKRNKEGAQVSKPAWFYLNYEGCKPASTLKPVPANIGFI